ncbi:hypothetical protein BASA81_005379 [Batrachochytrium salamandrivorans]|nr:hypothetical protein BASA81_005379 [Batrachochytrium salamandrivorans]
MANTWNTPQAQPWEEEDPNAAWAAYAPAAAATTTATTMGDQWQQPPTQQWPQQPQQPQQPQWQQPQQQWQQPQAQWQQPQTQWQAPAKPATQWKATPVVPPVVDWQAPNLNDPMLNAGLQAGKVFLDNQLGASLGQATQSYSSYNAQLKALYFNVNNSFVLAKLRTLLFPFLHKQWQQSDGGDDVDGQPVKHANSPDLYLPLMALSTYVLVVGLAKGTTHVFNPEIIVEVFGSSIFCQTLQVVTMKCSAFLLVGQEVQLSWLDLVAYSGYQFVGVAINMLMGVCFGTLAYNLTLMWTASCAAFVMFKTMQRVVGGTELSQKKLYFVLLCAILQVVIMWFLGFTRDLRTGEVFTTISRPEYTSIPNLVVDPTVVITTELEGEEEEEEIIVTQAPKRKVKKTSKKSVVLDV